MVAEPRAEIVPDRITMLLPIVRRHPSLISVSDPIHDTDLAAMIDGVHAAGFAVAGDAPDLTDWWPFTHIIRAPWGGRESEYLARLSLPLAARGWPARREALADLTRLMLHLTAQDDRDYNVYARMTDWLCEQSVDVLTTPVATLVAAWRRRVRL